jgi:hypothetical protein
MEDKNLKQRTADWRTQFFAESRSHCNMAIDSTNGLMGEQKLP